MSKIGDALVYARTRETRDLDVYTAKSIRYNKRRYGYLRVAG